MNNMALRGGVSPYRAYAQAVKLRRLDGKRLHFDKGSWLLGENEHLESATHAVALVPQLKIGWQFWRDGEPGDECIGLLSQGFQPPKRHELGDLDETLWERKSDGKPKDPWSKVNLLPLVLKTNEEVVTYTTPSLGGFAAIGELCEAFDTAPPATLPLIALEANWYTHKAYGRVHVPVLKILKYVPAARFDAILAASRGEPIAQPIEAPATAGAVAAKVDQAPPIESIDDGYAGPDNLDDINF
jgi:hypothetical protein